MLKEAEVKSDKRKGVQFVKEIQTSTHQFSSNNSLKYRIVFLESQVSLKVIQMQTLR